jgi:hypothetical protein
MRCWGLNAGFHEKEVEVKKRGRYSLPCKYPLGHQKRKVYKHLWINGEARLLTSAHVLFGTVELRAKKRMRRQE